MTALVWTLSAAGLVIGVTGLVVSLRLLSASAQNGGRRPQDYILLTADEFVHLAETGMLQDEDGYGRYLEHGRTMSTVLRPSDARSGGLNPRYTKIAWFDNR